MSKTIANTSPQRHANACITAAEGGNDQLTGNEILLSLTNDPRCSEWDQWELWVAFASGLDGAAFTELSTYTRRLHRFPVETHGEESRGTMDAEALEVATSPSVTFCCRMRDL
jgi:hypothetical protein